jgi:hypothetical protein
LTEKCHKRNVNIIVHALKNLEKNLENIWWKILSGFGLVIVLFGVFGNVAVLHQYDLGPEVLNAGYTVMVIGLSIIALGIYKIYRMIALVFYIAVSGVGGIFAFAGLSRISSISPLLLFIGMIMFSVGLIMVKTIRAENSSGYSYEQKQFENNEVSESLFQPNPFEAHKKSTVWATCSNCYGGKVTCTGCHGMRGSGGTEGICYTCNGSGQVNCSICKGKGSYEWQI